MMTDVVELPPVVVLDIIAVTDDGNGIAAPTEAPFDSDATILVLSEPNKPFAKGDKVLARLTPVATNEYEARIIRKLYRNQQRLFGLVVETSRGLVFESTERKRHTPFTLLPPDELVSFKAGDLVEAEILRQARVMGKSARVIRNLGISIDGGASDASVFSALTIEEFGIRNNFPEAALKEAHAASTEQFNLEGREDLRPLPLITIDGADARDFDDAVFAEADGAGGYRIIVAIADVAHFVPEGSALDKEACLRGNSVYLPDCVIPMLPPALSNGVCSLMPGEDRLCLAVEIFINSAGQKTKHRFFRAVMRSAARLTYEAVEDYRQGGSTTGLEGIEPKIIDNLLGAYGYLAEARLKRGALELDLPEKTVRFDDTATAIAIERPHQSVSQKLIEEMMICANVAAAETLEDAGMLCVFRVHEPPAYDRLASLYRLAHSMGLNLPRSQITPHHFNALLDEARQKLDAANFTHLNESILRCQAQADYRISNLGHFGLGLDRYVHFTSPIRRYADLIVHRQILALLEGRPNHLIPAEIAEVATAISESERKAVAAERRVVERFAAHLMEAQKGAITQGRIVGVARMGAFIDIDGAEGFLPVFHLGDDYYQCDSASGVIQGRRSGKEFRVGAEISVMIESISSLKATIDLRFVDGGVVAVRKPLKPPRDKFGGRFTPKPKRKAFRRYHRY